MQVIDVNSWEHFEQCISGLNTYLRVRRPDHLTVRSEASLSLAADASWTLQTTLERFRPRSTSV
jgi:hypothetical protein